MSKKYTKNIIQNKIICGETLGVLKKMPSNSVLSIYQTWNSSAAPKCDFDMTHQTDMSDQIWYIESNSDVVDQITFWCDGTN